MRLLLLRHHEQVHSPDLGRVVPSTVDGQRLHMKVRVNDIEDYCTFLYVQITGILGTLKDSSENDSIFFCITAFPHEEVSSALMA